jgi:hypothetical protein
MHRIHPAEQAEQTIVKLTSAQGRAKPVWPSM